MIDVFGLGHCCIDYISVLKPFPAKGKKGDVIDSLTVGGGPVPTALATLATFGRSTRFCGKVGDDGEGAVVRAGLSAAGVDISAIVIDPAVQTARASIWIDKDDGSRTVALDVTRFAWIAENELDDRLPAECRVFLTDGRAADASVKALNIARRAGVTTVLDAGSDRPRLREMLPLVDYAVVSEDLAGSILGGSQKPPDILASALIDGGVKTAVVTLGTAGALWMDDHESERIPGFAVDPVVDTTGAGDVFHGAFIHGLLEGWEIRRIIRFANAAAALSCRRLSGVGGIPELVEVEKLIR